MFHRGTQRNEDRVESRPRRRSVSLVSKPRICFVGAFPAVASREDSSVSRMVKSGKIQQTQMGMGQNPGTECEHQNSWDLWMFIPLKMDDYRY